MIGTSPRDLGGPAFDATPGSSTLARLQLTAFFEALLPRIRMLELDGEVEYSRTTFVSTFKRLPVRIELRAR